MDVQTALTDYLFSITHLAEKTQRVYQVHLTFFSQWCTEQGVQLEQINHRNVQSFLSHLKATHRPHKRGKLTLSTRTLQGYVSSILAFLHWCLADEEYSRYVKLSIVKQIKMPRSDLFLKSVFTQSELDALFIAAQHLSKRHEYRLRDTAILAVLLDTGLRASELRTLTIGNVTLAHQPREDSYITVMGKGRKQREIPLGNRARRALSRYLRQYRPHAKKSDPVFLSRHGGPLAHESLKDILQRLLTLSTLSTDVEVNPHKFRHTFATRYMAAGGDVYDLSRLLGHTSVSVTENYLKTLSAQAIRQRTKQHRSVLDDL